MSARPLDALDERARARLRRARGPRFVEPMLATLTDRRDLDDGWLLEHKFDGERCIAVVDGGRAALFSRSGRVLDSTYPELAAALVRSCPDRSTLDGEIVATDGPETLGFEQLQRRLGVRDPSRSLIEEVPVALVAFDILHLDGLDTTALGTRERRALLAAALEPGELVRHAQDEPGDSASAYARACAAGWEGLVAKRGDAPYRSGRSRDWLKLKCQAEQELVIGGFTRPRGTRAGFGALLLGYHEGDRLRYAGKVGTGFDAASLRDLTARLERIEQPHSPFAEPVRPLPAGMRWVRPELVAQVGFSEWTRAGRLRHPRFLGLRDDKAARDVVRERPSP